MKMGTSCGTRFQIPGGSFRISFYRMWRGMLPGKAALERVVWGWLFACRSRRAGVLVRLCLVQTGAGWSSLRVRTSAIRLREGWEDSSSGGAKRSIGPGIRLSE